MVRSAARSSLLDLPLSRDSTSTRSSSRSRARSANRTSNSPRALAVIADQAFERKAASAFRTAASTSAAAPRAIRAQGSPVNGSSDSNVAPSRAGVCLPPIIIPSSRTARLPLLPLLPRRLAGGVRARDAAEDRPGRQPGTAWIVVIEQPADDLATGEEARHHGALGTDHLRLWG